MREWVDEFVPELAKSAVVEHERRNESVVMFVVVAVDVEVGHKDVPGDTDPWGLMESWDGVTCCPYRACISSIGTHTHNLICLNLQSPLITMITSPQKILGAQKL